jgi:hypothetical protein
MDDMDILSPAPRRPVSSLEAISCVPVSTEPLHSMRGSWSLRPAYESAQIRGIPTPHIHSQTDQTSLPVFRHAHSRFRQPSFDTHTSSLPTTTHHTSPLSRQEHQSPPNSSWAVGNSLLRARHLRRHTSPISLRSAPFEPRHESQVSP